MNILKCWRLCTCQHLIHLASIWPCLPGTGLVVWLHLPPVEDCIKSPVWFLTFIQTPYILFFMRGDHCAMLRHLTRPEGLWPCDVANGQVAQIPIQTQKMGLEYDMCVLH